MRIATIRGYALSATRHKSLDGQRLLLAVPVDADLAPQIVLDNLGAAIGQRVLISSDGSEARKLVGDELSPGRWTVCGIIDPERSLAV